MLKKIFLSFFVGLFLLINLTQTARAATWFNQDPIEWYKKVYDTSISPEPEIFGERYTAAQVQWIFYSIISFPFTLLGSETARCVFSLNLTCIGDIVGSAITEIDKHPELATNQSKSFTERIFEDRPLSGITYFKNKLRKLEIIPTAHAQQAGFGFSALDPILSMWQAMRNIAYMFLILAALVLAFMVMFRVKISPQLVITAQSAIPRLVTAIILITFSYAIAGFLIDLMYVVIGLVSLLFNTPFSTLTSVPLLLSFPVYVGLFLLTLGIVIGTTIGIVASATTGAIAAISLLIPGVLYLVAVILLILGLIVIVLLIIHFFRTLFMLLRAFANILLLTIFAPLQLVAGTVVESLGFNAWLRSFISNLAVFVVVGVMLTLANWFLGQAVFISLKEFLAADKIERLANLVSGIAIIDVVSQESAGWPPFLSLGVSVGSGQGVAFVMLGVSFVIFTLIPRAAEVIQGLISGRPFAYGNAIGEFTGGPGAALGAIANMGKTGQGISEFSKGVSGLGKRILRRPPSQQANGNDGQVERQPQAED